MILFIIIYNLMFSFEIIDQSQNISQCENTSAIIYVLSNSENLEYNWFKDGVELIQENKNSISFDNLTFSVSGHYWCIIKNTTTNTIKYSNPIIVNIKKKTEIINKNINLAVFPNQTLKMKVDINDDFQSEESHIRWYDKSWNQLQNNKLISGSKSNLLTIKDVSDNQDKYYCVVNGDCGLDTAIFNLKYFNLALPQPASKTICENAPININLEINETNGLTLPDNYKIKIYNNERELKISTKIINDIISININEEMTIDKVGTYFCDINFENKNYSFKAFDLSVYLKTILENKSEDYITLKEGQNLNLFINVKGNIQNYIWLKNGIPIDTTNSNLLSINQALKEDSGTYSCIVKNFCQDQEFIISEVEIIENETILSIKDIKIQEIILLTDIFGNKYNHKDYNNLHTLKNGLYLIKHSNGKTTKIIKYE